ncbi:NADH-ubiquinone oxidoreductase 24 kDa subunit [Verticillium dahliae VDG2]|nr:NADH-ubiquinone oxidoreductase 24 kDa subunit [Verticillium dahliae VDG2]
MSALTHFDALPLQMDAQSKAISVEARKVGNAKAWWRRGRCLQEMGRLEEAREWVRRGLGMEGEEAELVALLREIETRIARGSKA